MPPAYDHLLADDPFDDSPPLPPTEGTLPPWNDMGKSWYENGRPVHVPCPPKIEKLVERLRSQAGDEYESGYSWGWNTLLKRVGERTGRDENFWSWEEFHLGVRKYSGITQIDIEIPGFPERRDSNQGFDSYCTSRTPHRWEPVSYTRVLIWRGLGSRYNDGWRDGPWWEKLEALAPELEAKTSRLAQDHARKVEAEKQAKKTAETNSYVAYLQKIKSPV